MIEGRGKSPNFWSFNFIYVKGLPLHFGSKTFTGFQIADLESWSWRFLLLLCSKKEDFWRGQNFKICNFKPSEGFPTKLKWQALDIYEIEWPKVDGHYWPPSIISSHFKKAILLYSYLMGYRYFCPYLYEMLFLLWNVVEECKHKNHWQKSFFDPIIWSKWLGCGIVPLQ